jgi:hypothetical protein
MHTLLNTTTAPETKPDLEPVPTTPAPEVDPNPFTAPDPESVPHRCLPPVPAPEKPSEHPIVVPETPTRREVEPDHERERKGCW